MSNEELCTRFLDIIEKDIAPKTEVAVKEGNKVFGAAVLLKKDLSLVIADTNHASLNPLFHGEVHTINKMYEMDHKTMPNPKDCIFLATHEPCSLCLSAITWTGFDNFYYLFSYEDSRDAFVMPYDIEILQEVFAVPPIPAGSNEERELYNRTNKFWKSHYVVKMIDGLEPSVRDKLKERVAKIAKNYAIYSDDYQGTRGDGEHAFS